MVELAVSIHRQTRAQFWDCMIYAACREAGVTRLYSEDVPGSAIPALEVINPFA